MNTQPKRLRKWVKLPNAWIENEGLHEFRWARGKGSDNLAALMALTVISHYADADTGIARLTYDDLSKASTLSRAKVSSGLDVLEEIELIEREPHGRSSIRLLDYDPNANWAMFPASGLYRHGAIAAFEEFHLRRRVELDALKLYFLFASRRDRHSNLAKISFDTIENYSGIGRNFIKPALSVLAANGLIHVERLPSRLSEYGTANAYRLAYIDPYRHMGTTGRGMEFEDI